MSTEWLLFFVWVGVVVVSENTKPDIRHVTLKHAVNTVHWINSIGVCGGMIGMLLTLLANELCVIYLYFLALASIFMWAAIDLRAVAVVAPDSLPTVHMYANTNSQALYPRNLALWGLTMPYSLSILCVCWGIFYLSVCRSLHLLLSWVAFSVSSVCLFGPCG